MNAILAALKTLALLEKVISTCKEAGMNRETDVRRMQSDVASKLAHLYVLVQEETSDYPGLSPEEVVALRDHHNKIEAIKLYRNRSGAGLKDAKDYIEAKMEKYHFVNNPTY